MPTREAAPELPMFDKDMVMPVFVEPGPDIEPLEEPRNVQEWRAAVAEIERHMAFNRNHLTAVRDNDILTGHLRTQDEINARNAEIAKRVARGAYLSETYNGRAPSKWHRAQPYWATVDPEGNIWGDFEECRTEFDITNKPRPAGRYLLRRNPLL